MKSKLRSLTEGMTFRSHLANVASILFGGRRNMYKSLGYKRNLEPADYRSRYKRNAVANRLVKALPKATWRGGLDIVEDEDPTTETTFEAAYADLDQRLKIESVLERADILAGIGRYAIVLIGGPGELETPLENCTADEITYLQPYAEEDARIERYETDKNNERFGLPLFYTITRTQIVAAQVTNSVTVGRRVHYTRVLHVADGLLDDSIFGEPRLECVWNLLDDLEKVTGGGAEAFWRRADQGRLFDLDPMLTVDEPSKDALKQQLKEYEHDLRRNLFTRGVKVESLGSDVADFSRSADSIISQISAGTGIPQRILMGSERGQLASTQDRSNWDDRVADRRLSYADPWVVRPLLDSFIALGVLPEPQAGAYDVRFSAIRVMDDAQRSAIAKDWAALNQSMGETVVTPNDIRVRVLGLTELGDVLGAEPGSQPSPIGQPKAAKKGVAGYEHVHRAADRFRTARTTYRERIIRRRQKGSQPHKSGARTAPAGY